jgi:hypothetical protein
MKNLEVHVIPTVFTLEWILMWKKAVPLPVVKNPRKEAVNLSLKNDVM